MDTEKHMTKSYGMDAVKSDTSDTKSPPHVIHSIGNPERVRLEFPRATEHTKETNKLLEGLGPRFIG